MLFGTYYGVIALRQNEESCFLDVRPSDGIALALRFGCPVYVAPKVMLEAGIPADRLPQMPCFPPLPDSESFTLFRHALQTLLERQADKPRIRIVPQGEQCHISVEGKDNETLGAESGGSFDALWASLCDYCGLKKENPFPQKGRMRFAFRRKDYYLEGTFGDRPEREIELTLETL